MPFVRILPVIILGILTANGIHIPVVYPAVVLGLAMVAGLVWRRSGAISYIAAAALLLFAMVVTGLRAPKSLELTDGRIIAILHIEENPSVSGRWTTVTAEMDKYRPVEHRGTSPQNPVAVYQALADTEYMASAHTGNTALTDNECLARVNPDAENPPTESHTVTPPDTDELWKRGGKVILRTDTSFHISVGDRLIATGRLSPVGGEGYESYARLMARRGYVASMWVNGKQETIILPDKARTPKYFASRMQLGATERMDRLTLDPAAAQVARAMTIGARGNMDRGLRDNYSITGTSHLLAVSGLHVGIVAMLINLLLYLLPAFRRGHIVKNIIAVATIWLYAMTTGLSPSVLRAAIMFTGVQLALASSRKGDSLNILLGTASVMLLINPNYLYDISFQLSFVAVLGIFMLYNPLYKLVRTRFRAVNALWAVIIIGVAASLATMPLVSYYFGRIPVIGIVMNPLVVATANITVLFSLLWIIMPFGFLNGIFSAVIGFSAGLQNDIVEFCATKSWASAQVGLSGWQTIFVYLAALAVWALIKYRMARSGKHSDQLSIS